MSPDDPSPFASRKSREEILARAEEAVLEVLRKRDPNGKFTLLPADDDDGSPGETGWPSPDSGEAA